MTTVECFICLQNGEEPKEPSAVISVDFTTKDDTSSTNDSIHILLCKNCKEKNVKVHRHCLDKWIKTKLPTCSYNVPCPHCRCEIKLTKKDVKEISKRLEQPLVRNEIRSIPKLREHLKSLDSYYLSHSKKRSRLYRDSITFTSSFI